MLEVMKEDPFLDADETISLGSLISTAMGSVDSCSVEEYVNGDLLQFVLTLVTNEKPTLWRY